MKFRASGFTLLEVLVALAIVAVGLAAALRASGAGTEGLLELRSRLGAQWLADNIAAEHTARSDWLAPGVQTRQEEMAGERFSIREEVTATPNGRFRRLHIQVASQREPQRALRDLVVYLVRHS